MGGAVFFVNKCKYHGIYLWKVLKRFKTEKKVTEIFARLIL